MIVQLTAGLLGVVLTAGNALAGECRFNDSQKVAGLQGNQGVGYGEEFVFESRVEKIDGEKYKYIYCIANKREHQGIRIYWHKGKKYIYFNNFVPNLDARDSFMESYELNYIVIPRTLSYDGVERNPVPETIVRASEGGGSKQTKKLGLNSGGTLDVAIDPKVADLIDKGEYTSLDRNDFVTMEISFISEYFSETEGKGSIVNYVYLTFPGEVNSEALYTILKSWPKYLSTNDEGIGLIFPDSDRINKFSVDPNVVFDGKLSSFFTQVEGSVREETGFLEVTDGVRSLGAVPISYFVPG